MMLLHRTIAARPPACRPAPSAPSHLRVPPTSGLVQFHQRSATAKAAGAKRVVTMQDWKAQGVDVLKQSLAPGIKQQLLHYGELVQATYDNLGVDRCALGYGDALEDPQKLLAYTQGSYSLDSKKPAPADWHSTHDSYKLPKDFTHPTHGAMCPLLEALPGKGKDNPSSLPKPPAELLLGVWNAVINKVFDTVPGLLINYIDSNNGGRTLFTENSDGRGKKPRGTFFAYVAVSEPPAPLAVKDKAAAPAATADSEAGRDVVLVWRGTIFKEEWESNFAQDELALWNPGQSIAGANSSTEVLQAQSLILPKADEVGVHAGFSDLFTRKVSKVVEGKDVIVPSPREMIHAWLPRLLEKHKVATITVTGHSLGGGLATLAAFDVAQHLEQNWDKSGWRSSNWETKERPQVRLITFASPRLGNATFVDTFHGLGIAALRIENKGDIVPNVPGIWVQALSTVVETFSKEAAVDMTSGLVATLRNLYRSYSNFSESLNWYSRWGYFHVGQVLALDPEWAGPKFLDAEPFGRKHNLELYIYLLSLLGEDGPGRTTSRNPLLLNKSDDLLADKSVPADWWREPGKRGYKQLGGLGGPWVYP